MAILQSMFMFVLQAVWPGMILIPSHGGMSRYGCCQPEPHFALVHYYMYGPGVC